MVSKRGVEPRQQALGPLEPKIPRHGQKMVRVLGHDPRPQRWQRREHPIILHPR